MLNSNTLATTSGTRSRRSAALSAAILAALGMAASSTAFADQDLDALKKQVQEMQQKIEAMERQQAQQAPAVKVEANAPAPKPTSDALSMYGVTLSGIFDVGVSYINHAAPISDYFGAGTYSYIQKYNTRTYFGASENGISQSRITLSGDKELLNGWSGIFRLETAFNPLSGNLSDALKSLTVNNGRPCGYTGAVQPSNWTCTYTTGADSSVDGELFNSAAFVGIANKQFGTLTIGRQNGLLADGIAKYDPMAASQAFSVIGISGTAGGGGNTEDRRLDNSLKYNAQFGALHAGVQYQFGGASGSTNSAWQLVLGGVFPSMSVDAFYAKKDQAVGSASLSAAQVTTLNCPYKVVVGAPAPCNVAGGGGNPLDKSLLGTITDTTTWGLMTQWNIEKWKLFLSYEHIQFSNPSTPLPAGSQTLGGYVLAYVNNASIPAGQSKVFQFVWLGAKYSFTPSLDWTVAWYRQEQSAFATGANAGCNDIRSAQCSGVLNAYSTDLVYRLTKRFDIYGGAMWSGVQGGLANGYLLTTEINPTVGVRYTF
jgi:predicted porin